MKTKNVLLGAVAIGAIAAIVNRKKQLPVKLLYVSKDAPLYSEVRGIQKGTMPAFVQGKRQQITIKRIVDRKWLQIEAPTTVYMKWRYLQVNDATYDQLMAKEEVIVYEKPSRRSKKIHTLSLGRIVKVEEGTMNSHWTKISMKQKGHLYKGYIQTAYMKY